MIVKDNRVKVNLFSLPDGGVFQSDGDYYIKVNRHSHFNGACEHGKSFAVRLRDGYVCMIENTKFVDFVNAALVIDYGDEK